VRSEAASHGAAAFLAKPFLGSALLAAIHSAI
jgi:FixJ family two-component response regulator